MQRALLQQLSTSEFDNYIHELDHAIEAHITWFTRINRNLIFLTPPADTDLAEHPEHLCSFGRWYQSVGTPEVLSDPAYAEIGVIHHKVHESAKNLLSKLHEGNPISIDDYDAFVQHTNALRESAQRLRAALKRNQGLVSRLMLKVYENASEGVIITDPGTHILQVNDAFTRVTGYRKEEVIGQRPAMLYSGRQNDDFYRQMWHQISESGHWEGEIWNRRKNGDVYLEWLSIAAVKDDNGNTTHYVGIFTDITRAKDNEQQLLRLAHFDQLTQLPNRTLFLDRLHHAMAMARRERKQIAVLFLDLDGFKAVNDSLGHAAGHELLRQVAQRLAETLRESDTVSRFGGDEFTIVLPDVTGNEGVEITAGKLIEAIARPYLINGHSAHITTSLGISLYPTMADSSEKLITQADMAMYHAKNHGKNHYEFFKPDFEGEV
jgi:diguanylate cyclase (GGDEF)-like protein/PAS domain S-box-containing protein